MELTELQKTLLNQLHDLGKIPMTIQFDEISKYEFILLMSITKIQKLQETTEGISVSKLAKCMHTSSPSVSRSLKNLEERGYIERTTDKNDRRNTIVSITAQGDLVLKQNQQQIREYMQDIIDRVGEDETRKFISLLQQFNEAARVETKKINKKEDETE